jgi:hypothetical protein
MATPADRDRQLTNILRASIVDDEPPARPRRRRRSSAGLWGMARRALR